MFVFRVRKQLVNVPSYIVRLDSQKHIDFALTSPFGGGRPGKKRECIFLTESPEFSEALNRRGISSPGNCIIKSMCSVVALLVECAAVK